jgi:la-related protein 1
MSTTFSYAQAAKGQLSTTPSAVQSVTSQAAETASNQNTEASTTAGAPTASHSIAPSTSSSHADAKDPATHPSTQSHPVNKIELDTVDATAQESDSAQKNIASDTASVTATEKKPTAETSTERRAKGSSARSDTSDNRKAKKGKKSKVADKESEPEQTSEKEKEPEAPKVQLSEAPIPTVNYWVQRAKEAQTKVVQPRTPAANVQESKSKASVSDNDNSSRSPATTGKGQKKDIPRDVAEQAPRRHAPRGSRVFEKTTEPLPSVADAASWPTPETAATETKSQETAVKSAENEESHEDKADSGPKDKPKWVAIPFVPSAVFETPLPSRNPRGSKAGAPRGGRDAGARGHANVSSTADRSQAASGARPSGERSVDGANGARPTSAAIVPTKRASIDAAIRDVRKVSGPNKDAANSSTTQVRPSCF